MEVCPAVGDFVVRCCSEGSRDTTSQLKHGLGDRYPAAVLQKLEAKLRILLLGHKNWVLALYVCKALYSWFGIPTCTGHPMVTHMAAEGGQARTALLLAREAETQRSRVPQPAGEGLAPPQASRPQLLPGTQHPRGTSHSLYTCQGPFPNENGQKRGSPATLCVLPVKGKDYPLMGPSQVPHWPGP